MPVSIGASIAAMQKEKDIMDSPCLTCTRVKNPRNCENKTCKDWQAWFIDRWEAMRRNIRTGMDRAPITEQGVPLGGRQYASPHRVREFLQTDPCNTCYCPRDVCTSPCQLKLAWEERKGEKR